MNVDEILSDQARIAYPVGIEETGRRLSQKKGKTINFSLGQSGPEAIPYDYFREFFLSLSRASEEELRPIALYGATRGGSTGLEAVKKIAKKDGIDPDEKNICLSSGALEGFYLLTRALANKGDTVCCEAPTYSINLKSLIEQEFNIIGIPVRGAGIDMDYLENVLKSGKRTKFVYVIPDFQNPTGLIMSLEKRKQLIRLAREHEFIIIEDAPYRLISYDNVDLPPTIYSLAPDVTIFVGTASKMFCAGPRFGYLIGHETVIERVRRFKQCAGYNIPELCQRLVHGYLSDDTAFEKYMKRILTVQKEKRDLMLRKLEESFPRSNGLSWSKPKGGIFIWVELPEGTDADLIWLEAIEKEGIGITPGKGFFPYDCRRNNCFRLNFTFPTNAEIIEGIPRLANIVNRYL
ncbi:MAG: aminotransferase class I/II-fold pyridoxal phosphate-dependent enzyme [Candidatus Aminicenantes bacterium]|nr:aminotransferase class I/II-fold pyridoxal phosphate-dependent enzyme [Candidatus Aminicenantes bacterium]NIM83794.1 aminotransferase class I/II-fold pyridoxal phosphate-dependent enzyme [Candidatus Aminicenantes bacterium]NIN21841.1 aminotransferase class I/II-fold pyridoxal phosphate-dependent enzyme [Candidatus Aminicenantes bacterium]NIN46948.1 aminotransferase class I/II-fold pyridoxal phosphate-dependent enzyme [Candidatus Aminicenantes bacterium]NIN89870.1 aminotransferase class I/II-